MARKYPSQENPSVPAARNMPLGKGTQTIIAQRTYSGPLPPPEDLAAYKELIPDAPARLLAMAERQQQHRIEMENEIVRKDYQQVRRGQWLGVFIALVFIGGAIYLAMNDHDWVAGTMIGVTLVGVVSLLIKGKKSESEPAASIDNPQTSRG